jgi:type II secretory ATPase GspE/PulE/Tfp pilus assembly ATPase PilB-like protein
MIQSEIRDAEVVNLAAQCAITGHVVLATLYAETAPGGIRRLVELGLERFLVNAILAGVISQRLVRTLCPECRKCAMPPRHSMPAEAIELIERMDGVTFYAAAGCSTCHRTGYRGRTAIHEVLIPDDRVREAVAAGATTELIHEAAVAAGMRTRLACGIQKAAQGITTIEEVLRVAPPVHGR